LHFGNHPLRIVYCRMMVRRMLPLLIWLTTLPAVEALRSASEEDYPPLAVTTLTGEASGLGVDMLRAAARQAGYQVRFHVAAWHQIRQQLLDGELDVLPAMAYDQQRAKSFDFSLPYLRTHGALFQRQDLPAHSDLAGLTLLVMQDDIMHDYLRQQDDVTMLVTDTLTEAFKRHAQGEGAGVLATRVVGWHSLTHLDLQSIQESPIVIPVQQRWCFAVKRGHNERLWDLNEALIRLEGTGETRQILEAWLTKEQLGSDATLRHWLIISLLALGSAVIAGLACLLLWTRQIQATRWHQLHHDLLINAIGDAVLVHRINEDGRCGPLVEVNLAACRLLGYPREQLLGLPAHLIHPSQQHLCRHLHDGQCRNHQQEFLNVSGARIPVEIRSQRYQQDGESFVICVARDLRHLRKHEQALAQSEARLRRYLEHAPHALFVTSSDGHYIDHNPAALRMTGFSHDELLGMAIIDLVHPDERQRALDNFQRVLDKGRGEVCIRLRRKNTTGFFAQVNAVRLDNDQLMAFVIDLGDLGEPDLEPPVADSARVTPVQSARVTPVQSARVLLVDDQELNRVVATRMLERIGAEAVAVSSGQQALEQLQHQHFDIVFMDCQMPDMDGFDTTKRIRANEAEHQLPRTPIIALTANAYAEDRDRSVAAGMDGHLAKPVHLKALHETLNRWLQG
jgi:PAS domain S-box-containing protein